MALAFYVVWGINHSIWSDFFEAMSGSLIITGSRTNNVASNNAVKGYSMGSLGALGVLGGL